MSSNSNTNININNKSNNHHPSAAATSEKADVADVLEERLIDAEYKIWKKNTPYLYDFVMTHSLEWPSLTCQWLPNPKNSGDSTTEHSLLLGTHTTGEQNYVMLASVNLPKNDAVLDYRTSNSAANGPETQSDGGSDKQQQSQPHSTPSAHYDEEKKEVGGFGHANSGVGKIEIKMKVKHEGEVNRARYMPQNHFFVATRGPNPTIYIYDLSKHPSFPSEESEICPQAVCIGHAREGYGLAWSKHQEGRLVSGSEDKSLCLWDISQMTGTNANNSNATASNINNNSASVFEKQTTLHPISTFNGHKDVVEDVDWHHKDANMIGSVGDDKAIMIWDVREKNPNKAVHEVNDAHVSDINCIAFNPINEFVLATGSADKTVALWDMRNLKTRLQTLSGHTDQVYQVEWAPFNESVLASCSADRRVATWDLSRIGMEQTPEDAEDGPPELLFMHGGHTSKVSDVSWNSKDDWTIATVSEDNVMQVWNMAEEIYTPEDEEEMNGTGEGEDQLLGDDDIE